MKISWGRSPRARASSTCRLKSAVYCTMRADTELTFGFFRSTSCCALVSVYRFCIDDLIIQRNRTGCFLVRVFRGSDQCEAVFYLRKESESLEDLFKVRRFSKRNGENDQRTLRKKEINMSIHTCGRGHDKFCHGHLTNSYFLLRKNIDFRLCIQRFDERHHIFSLRRMHVCDIYRGSVTFRRQVTDGGEKVCIDSRKRPAALIIRGSVHDRHAIRWVLERESVFIICVGRPVFCGIGWFRKTPRCDKCQSTQTNQESFHKV